MKSFWSAPAERSVDGALDPKRCRATTTPARLPSRGPRACHRTPKLATASTADAEDSESKPHANRHQPIAAVAATARSEDKVRVGAGRLEEEGRSHVAHR